MKNKVALALTLALGSMAAQAQDTGMDISISTKPRAPAATPAASPAPATPANAAAAASNQQALAPVKPATAQAFPAAAPAPKAAPVNKAAVRVEPQKPVEPAQLVAQAPRAAQPAPVATPSMAPVAAAPIAVAPSAPAAPAAPTNQMSGSTNPFTGKQLDIEARQAQIESAKLDTDLMVERLKQANLLADLTYLPLKKKAEVTTMPGVLAAAGSPAKPAATDAAPATTPRKAVKKSSKKATPKPVPTETPIVRAPEPAKISLAGITINGDKASVLLEVEGGGVFSAAHGDLTPYGKVRVVDGRSVVLGERHMTMRDSMLARMYVSDAAPVDEKIKNNTVITAPPSTQPSAANIPLPPLPPLPKAVMPKAPAPMPSR